MKYTIVYTSTLEDLIIKVSKLIQDGWIPQGGVCESVDGYTGHLRCSQAMIKN